MHVTDNSTSGGVLCCGSIVYDIVVRPADDARWGTTTFVESLDSHTGGNGANTSIALARTGTPVRLIGAVGDDDRGRFVLEQLRSAGVDTSRIVVLSHPTAATVVIVNSLGDRKFLHRMGASVNALRQPLDFSPPVIDGMAHFHLASFYILPGAREHGPEMLRRARHAGLTTSLDTTWDPLGRWMADLEPCLAHVDILFLNEDESRMVTGSDDPETAARIVLDRGAGTAVMKLGGRGCALYTAEREVLCPAFEVDAKDTTGAGDCFAAGFLSALQRGASLAEAGRFANAVAAMSVQRVGAVAGVPHFPEIQAWIGSARLRTSPAEGACRP